MLNLLLSIKWITGILGVLCVAATIAAIASKSYAVFLFAPFAALLLVIAYMGFRVQSKVEKTAQIAIDLANEHVGKVSDALVDRINK